MTRSNKFFSDHYPNFPVYASLRPVARPVPPPPAFLADRYDVTATLDPITQTLSAVTKIEFKARDVSSARARRAASQSQRNRREICRRQNARFRARLAEFLNLIVNLPNPVATGAKVTLTFTYAGPLANEENSPVPGVRAAAYHPAMEPICFSPLAGSRSPTILQSLHKPLSAQRSGSFRGCRHRQSWRAYPDAGKKHR